MAKYFLGPLLLIILLIGCKLIPKEEHAAKRTVFPTDYHSYAQPNDAIVKHLDLDLTVSLDSQLMTGKASWDIDNMTETDVITFDTRELSILKVTTTDGSSERETKFTPGRTDSILGTPLDVPISPTTKKVIIYYTASSTAPALQWLTAQQTAGKQKPFLFTQSEAILARTWIPCQDAPAIRFTYNAKVIVPKGYMALMSGVNPQQLSPGGEYHFHQPNPIPSYLLALAVGDIAFQPIDKRTGVYAEPVTLPKAAYEFADMGKMVSAAEKLYGPYRWGRYDLLVLPPSFPFGGMENPMLTFATPTVIAGDRSLVSLVAHELAHSWSGNLVTNATWDDFWLNEGFTMYFERRITEAVYGKDEKEMQEVLGLGDLYAELNEMGVNNPDTRLKLDLKGRDPDDGSTDIPYEKGYLFLRHIEDVIGRERWDNFLYKYFNENAFQSMTTEEFVRYFHEHLKVAPSVWNSINLKEWIYKPGLPKEIPLIHSRRFSAIDSMLKSRLLLRPLTGLSQTLRTTNERLYLINHLSDTLSNTQMTALDNEFHFTNSGNAEIQAAWYLKALKNNYRTAYPNIEQFLTIVGRRKFLVPLYKEMIKTPGGLQWARKVYQIARPNYHPVSYRTIDQLLK